MSMTPPRPSATSVMSESKLAGSVAGYRASPYSSGFAGDHSDWSPRDEDAAMALVTLPSSPFRCMPSPSLTPSRINASPMTNLDTFSPLTPSTLRTAMMHSPMTSFGMATPYIPLVDHMDPFETYDHMLDSPDKSKGAQSGRLFRNHLVKHLKNVFPEAQTTPNAGNMLRGGGGHPPTGVTPKRSPIPTSNKRIVITPCKNHLRKPQRNKRNGSPTSFKLEIDPESPGVFSKKAKRLNTMLRTPSGQRAALAASVLNGSSTPEINDSIHKPAASSTRGKSRSKSKNNSRATNGRTAKSRTNSSQGGTKNSLTTASTGSAGSNSGASANVGPNRKSITSVVSNDGKVRQLRPHINAHARTSTSRKAEHTGCNCKKSRCLKLYCECFSANLECKDICKCQNCHNNAAHASVRSQAIRNTLSRNADAFKPKIGESSGKHAKGCHCKKSGCKKKYCECFQAGIYCGQICKCKDCENTCDGTVIDRTVNKNSKNSRPSSKKTSRAVASNAALSSPTALSKASKRTAAGKAKAKAAAAAKARATPTASQAISPLSPGTTPLHGGTKRLGSHAIIGSGSGSNFAILPRQAGKYCVFGKKNPEFTQQTVLNIFAFLSNEDLFRIMPVSKIWTKFSLHKDLWQTVAGDANQPASGITSPLKRRKTLPIKGVAVQSKGVAVQSKGVAVQSKGVAVQSRVMERVTC